MEVLKKIKSHNKHIDWLYFNQALGIGKAYIIGFGKVDSNFTHVLTLDADLNHDPAVIPDLITEMKKSRADLVIGSRFVEGGKFDDKRWWKRLISKLMNKIVIFMVKIKIHDISSGYRLMKRELIDDIKYELKENGYPNYMELVIRSSRRGYKLAEVPIVYKARIWGKSKMGKLKTMFDYLGFLPRIFLTS